MRTIVCDLIGRSDGGSSRSIASTPSPGDAAIALARALERGLGIARAPARLKSLAADGLATRWCPDLRSFEEAALEELGAG